MFEATFIPFYLDHRYSTLPQSPRSPRQYKPLGPLNIDLQTSCVPVPQYLIHRRCWYSARCGTAGNDPVYCIESASEAHGTRTLRRCRSDEFDRIPVEAGILEQPIRSRVVGLQGNYTRSAFCGQQAIETDVCSDIHEEIALSDRSLPNEHLGHIRQIRV